MIRFSFESIKNFKATKRSSQERHRYDTLKNLIFMKKNLKILKKVKNIFQNLKNPVKERKIFIKGKVVWVVASKKKTEEIQKLLDQNQID